MTSIEDQTNQLFSSIVKASRLYESCTYENQSYLLGTGPLKYNDGRLCAFLDETQNILGFGHPLAVKKALLSALDSNNYASLDGVRSFINELNDFLAAYLQGASASIGIKGDKQLFDLGRSINFFSQSSLNALSSGGFCFSTNLFNFPISITTGASFSSQEEAQSGHTYLTHAQLELAKAQLKLMKLGSLYGETGAIKRKQSLLEDFFSSSSVDIDGHCEGLIFTPTKNLSNSNIFTGVNDALFFPYLIDEQVLEAIAELINE